MKTLLKVILLLGVLLGLLAWSQREHLGAFAHILPSYAAKEYCSCRYVMQRSMSDCQAYVRECHNVMRDRKQVLKRAS